VSRGVRRQNVRHFTVQIRHAASDLIVGTGVLVTADGQVATCAHVVSSAGVDPAVAGGEVGVYFPQATEPGARARRARVVAGAVEDDVALLRLVGEAPPVPPDQVAVLGGADLSFGNPFESYGYRRLDHYSAGRADGTVQGDVEPPDGRAARLDPLQIRATGGQINRGMSGAAMLDTVRNLVVGLISETYVPDASSKDRDTAWAVNARILGLAPFSLPLHDDSLPLREAPGPREAVPEAGAPSTLPARLEGAPTVTAEWVGRADLLDTLTADWAGGARRVVGLIGFGGDGKSLLARRWIDQLEAGPVEARPAGVFWWSFNDQPIVDRFLEEALRWLGAGRLDPARHPSAVSRAHLIAALLAGGRYLLVLDGLEAVQRGAGDSYGLIASEPLRILLRFFAAPEHASFCVVTSRLPVLDLMEYTTYAHHDVARLTTADGIELLRRLGVRGAGEVQARVVERWDGHALTLSIVGANLVERHGGDVTAAAGLLPEVEGQLRAERLTGLLRSYDTDRSDAERVLLKLLGLFRRPVEPEAVEWLRLASPATPAAALGELDKPALQALLARLTSLRILRYDAAALHYTVHPLIRSYYVGRLADEGTPNPEIAHALVARYYVDRAGVTRVKFLGGYMFMQRLEGGVTTLEELEPWVEAVHHACLAGRPEVAHRFVNDRLQGGRHVLTAQLAAFDTMLDVMRSFFQGGDLSRPPLAEAATDKRWALDGAGFILMNLGRLAEAAGLLERALEVTVRPGTDILTLENLAQLHAHRGALGVSAETGERALAMVGEHGDRRDQLNGLCWQATVATLRGQMEAAARGFSEAEALSRDLEPGEPYLYSLRGIQHADYLRRAGDIASARRVTEANLVNASRNQWRVEISQGHRVLGDLDVASGAVAEARGHYDHAVRVARGTSHRPVLLRALLSRAALAAQQGDGATAAADLAEARDSILDGGYRVFEADWRVASAWAELASGHSARAREEADRARRLSAELGYHWGDVDARAVLDAVEERRPYAP
jgi:tetratricopeptide (TPR) repeat protein